MTTKARMQRISMLLVAIIIAFSGCKDHPPLEITPEGSDCLDFNLQTLSEYATRIDYIEVIDINTHEIVWAMKLFGQ